MDGQENQGQDQGQENLNPGEQDPHDVVQTAGAQTEISPVQTPVNLGTGMGTPAQEQPPVHFRVQDQRPESQHQRYNLASSITKYTDLGILWKMRTIAEAEARRCGKNHINNTSISMGNHTNTRQTPLHQTTSL